MAEAAGAIILGRPFKVLTQLFRRDADGGSYAVRVQFAVADQLVDQPPADAEVLGDFFHRHHRFTS